MILSEQRYDLERGNIQEVQDPDLRSPEKYLETVGEFADEDEALTYLSFVLEDSGEKDFRPSVEFVSGLEDFSFES